MLWSWRRFGHFGHKRLRGISSVFHRFSKILIDFVRFSAVFSNFSRFSAILDDLQRFGAISGILGTLLGALGRSWGALGRSWGDLEAFFEFFLFEVLFRSDFWTIFGDF